MKHLNKILIPFTTTLIPISIVGCSCGQHKDPDGYSPIPKDFLNIDENHILRGFKEGHQREHQLKGYNKLTIPNDIVGIKNHSFTYDISSRDYDGPAVIKKIDFEQGCTITGYGGVAFSNDSANFCFLDNLEIVVFPPQYNAKDAAMFGGCSKLKTFDLTNIVADTSGYDSSLLASPDDLGKNGQIIMKNGQTNVQPFADYLYNQLSEYG